MTIARALRPRVRSALLDRPATVVAGPLQAGKSTLVRSIAAEIPGAGYLSLDDSRALATIAADPSRIASSTARPLAIDECWRLAPALSTVISQIAEAPVPGRFLLTASVARTGVGTGTGAQPLGDPLVLWPLSQGEIDGHAERFVDAVFSDDGPAVREGVSEPLELVERMLRGGFPATLELGARQRDEWMGAFLSAVLQRCARALSDLASTESLLVLLVALAERAGTPLNRAELSRATSTPWSTLDRHAALLRDCFLVHDVEAWSAPGVKRLARARKTYVADSALFAHALRLDAEHLSLDARRLASLVETFAVNELVRQVAAREDGVRLTHFARHQVAAVNLVLEREGALVGIEVTSAPRATPAQLKGLRVLAEVAGERFVRGIVLHAGRSASRLSEGPAEIWSLPLEALWETR